MGDSSTVRRFSGRLLVVFLLAVAAVLILTVSLSMQRRGQQVVSARRRFVEDVERRGGRVVLAPSSTRAATGPLLAVDLSGASLDSGLVGRLITFSTIERLNLDGARLASEDYRALGELANLQKLSLSGSDFSDHDLPVSGLQLTALSLRDTSITDAGLSRLRGMTSLANLDITGTSVTGEGLRSLAKLPSLTTLEVDQTCITDDGVSALNAVNSLQIVRVHVADGAGRQAKEAAVSLAESFSVHGVHPSGHVLWDAEQPWDETLAGVVEAVTREVGLDARQVTDLIEAIGSAGTGRQTTGRVSPVPARPVRTGEAIESAGEFLRRLQNMRFPFDEDRQFACNGFRREHVPQLLKALRAQANLLDSEYLVRFGAYLLVRHGSGNTDAIRELDRLLTHTDPTVRSIAAYGFDLNGHPLGEDWSPDEDVVGFGLPRLQRLAKDPNVTVRLAAAEVIGSLAHHHPSCAAEAMATLVGMLEDGHAGYVSHAVKRIAEVSPQVARDSIPRLRRLLNDAETRTVATDAALAAMCELARHDPELAHEVAVDLIGLIHAGKTTAAQAATLVSRENAAATKTLVHELLQVCTSNDERLAGLGQRLLLLVAKAVRDAHTAEQPAP